MTTQISLLISDYHLAVMIVMLAVLAIVALKKNSKILTIAMATLSVAIVYEVVFKEPVTSLPARINRVLNEPSSNQSTNLHYYQLPEEEKKLLGEL